MYRLKLMRRANWVVAVNAISLPEAEALGKAIAEHISTGVPFVRGIDKFLTEMRDTELKEYLDAFDKAVTSGGIKYYHIENITRQAKEKGKALIIDGSRVFEYTEKG